MPTKPTPAQITAASKLGLVIAHPLRILILNLTDEWETSSASNVSEELEIPISNLSYHFNVLVKTDCLLLSRTAKVRGATEYIYRLSPIGKSILELVTRLDDEGKPTAQGALDHCSAGDSSGEPG